MPKGHWQSYKDISEAPQSVQDEVAAQQSQEPIAVVTITIYGTGAGQSAVSVDASQAGPFAAFKQASAAPRQRAARNIHAIANRELATVMNLFTSM